jgi:hypothetical protein
LRCHFLSGISPSLVLSDAMDMSEKRFRKLVRRPALLPERAPPSLLLVAAGPGGGFDA